MNKMSKKELRTFVVKTNKNKITTEIKTSNIGMALNYFLDLYPYEMNYDILETITSITEKEIK